MEANPLTADPHMEVNALRGAMLERHARYIPIMEAGTLMGVLSFHDVAKAVFEEQSFETACSRATSRTGRTKKKQRHKPASRRLGWLVS